MVPIRYNLRSLAVRKTSTAATVLGIGLVVFVLAASLMLTAGLKKAMKTSGEDDVAVVLRKGSDNELASAIEDPQIGLISALPGVQQKGGKPMTLAEIVVVAAMNKIILVLILFAVLLTNRIEDVKISNVSLPRLGAAVPALFGAVGLLFLLLSTPWPQTTPAAAPTTARLGDAFLREYLLPFELASMVLLLALIGAVVIARRAVREEALDPDPHHERLV